MDTFNLPLFSTDTSSTKSVPASKITEEKIIQPLKQVLNTIVPSTPMKRPTSITKSLDDLFPEQEYEEKTIKRAKEVLGSLTDKLTSDQLRDSVAEIQFLVNTWLDEFEQTIFDGLTLRELLHEKGDT